MKKRLISLFLVLAMLLCLLASCGGDGGVVSDGGDRVDGSWASVDFKGQKVRFAVSVNQYSECSFPAADIYTKGPDTADSNEVTKEVLARNAKVKSEINIEIEYVERDLPYLKVLEDVSTTVLSASANSPDVYNNDLWGLSRAMYQGYLWNVKNPGADADGVAYKNYFDFEADGWYTEFIKGSTFDQNKYYLFAGDYFIDMIRLAWVIYVNNDKLAENVGKLPAYLGSVDDFYAYVADGEWDFDMLTMMINKVYVGSNSGKTEKNDTLIGFAINNVTDWSIGPSVGAAIFYLDENYQPKIIENTDTFLKIANKYVKMVGQKDNPTLGVFFEQEPLATTETFMQGNVLFASSRLGEMEAAGLRGVSFNKGVVPVPKWDYMQQKEYRTVVHDQTEIGCILKSAKAFSASSALMQFLNEESKGVVNAYYEKGMKYKYNDDANSRLMMDMVRASIDDPFSSILGLLSLQLYDGGGKFSYVGPKMLDTGTITSTFDSEKYAYASCLQKMLDKFAAFD